MSQSKKKYNDLELCYRQPICYSYSKYMNACFEKAKRETKTEKTEGERQRPTETETDRERESSK